MDGEKGKVGNGQQLAGPAGIQAKDGGCLNLGRWPRWTEEDNIHMDGAVGRKDRASKDYLGSIPEMKAIGLGRMVVVGASRTPRERKDSGCNGPLPPCIPFAIPKLPTRWRAGAKRPSPLPFSAPQGPPKGWAFPWPLQTGGP